MFDKYTILSHAEQCLALYSRWWTQMYTCFHFKLYRLLSPRARQEAFCCYVIYCIVDVYRIVTTVSGYVSYRGKLFRCRPTKNTKNIPAECFCYILVLYVLNHCIF